MAKPETVVVKADPELKALLKDIKNALYGIRTELEKSNVQWVDLEPEQTDNVRLRG